MKQGVKEKGADEHASVLWQESMDALQIKGDGFYVDGTFGRGGHTRGILKQLGPKGLLVAIDQDPQAEHEAKRLQQEIHEQPNVYQGEFLFIKARFSKTAEHVCSLGRDLQGVLLDLGVSSPQLDQAERGFSFQHTGPLDMRMDTSDGTPLSVLLAEVTDTELADVLWKFGDERYSKRIAKAIVKARDEGELASTTALAEVIRTAHPRWQRGKHPATKSFQAMRIWVNQELTELSEALRAYSELLVAGGRMVVISFHSLEDRLVKQFFRQSKAIQRDLPPWLAVGNAAEEPSHVGVRMRALQKMKATKDEVKRNPRARSAVLRVAERLG